MAIRRVAVVYDDTARPETTGNYCFRALQQLVGVHHFLPTELARIPRQGIDLYLNIDDGLRYQWPADLRPCAWWAIDTHLDFAWCLSKARDFDILFAAQRDGTLQLRDKGVATDWLPLACDPAIHTKHEVEKVHDVCFVGHVFPGPRAELLEHLRRRFRNTFTGQLYFEEMARAYSASRVVFNRSIRNDINMRVFEALACGSLLLTNDLQDNGQSELFRDSQHLATYTELEELLDKAAYYLEREDVRERIAAAGRAEALARHTYRHRMEVLLDSAERALGRTTLGPGIPTNAPVPSGQVPPPAQPRIFGGAHSAPSLPSVAPLASAEDCEVGVYDPLYCDLLRPEILALVPSFARHVLDIGCGTGRLGEAIQARQQAEVVGIEQIPAAAATAQRRLHRVLVGDIEQMELPFAPGSFDAIVCADVLEHLRKPDRLLCRARDWLRPGGTLIASIPNVRHHSVVRSLIDGNWTYEAAGLLDRTHLRFFTRRGIEDLFHWAGFRVQHWEVVPGPGHDAWQQQGRPGKVQVGRLRIEGIRPEEAEEFFVYQYLLAAECVRPTKPASNSAAPPQATAVRHASSGTPDAGPLHFRQDFIRDFEQFDFLGPPFAFVRFADGERAICEGQAITVLRDGWAYSGGPSEFADALRAALHHAAPDYYFGISDGCCDQPARDWYLGQLRVPLQQVTFSNIFINWNYRRFRQLDLRRMVTVSSQGADFLIPEDCCSAAYDFEKLVDQLLTVDRPILVAAGPASAIIIHKYWQRAARKQTIVDVGSAIDEKNKGTRTRPYQQPGTRTAELVCRW